MLRDLSKALCELWRAATATDEYRPERHYMRGPGPRWCAKYGTLAAAAVPAAARRSRIRSQIGLIDEHNPGLEQILGADEGAGWKGISTAPFDRDLELAVIDRGLHALHKLRPLQVIRTLNHFRRHALEHRLDFGLADNAAIRRSASQPEA